MLSKRVSCDTLEEILRRCEMENEMDKEKGLTYYIKLCQVGV